MRGQSGVTAQSAENGEVNVAKRADEDFHHLSEHQQVGFLINSPEPHLVDCTPSASTDDTEAAIIRLLQFNTWYRFLVLFLTLVSIALGIYNTWLALQTEVQASDCETIVPAGEDPLTFNTPCGANSFYCNREQCCNCSTIQGFSVCADESSFVCHETLSQACDDSDVFCATEHIYGDLPVTIAAVDGVNLVLLVILLVDLILCIHYLSKSVCYCRCCAPCASERGCSKFVTLMTMSWNCGVL